MNKNFYIVNLDYSKSYKPLCDLVNYSAINQIHWIIETSFSSYLKLDKILYSCNKEDTEKFEEMLKKYNVSFKKVSGKEKDYQDYLNTFSRGSTCGKKIPDNNQKLIFEEKVPQIIEGSNGRQYLTEGTIINKDKIRVYVESNEMCKHNIPHAHVDYNHDFNVFSISLVDFSILAGNSKGPKARKAIELLTNNIVKAKQIWNTCANHSKFDCNDKGDLLNTYHYE